MNTSKKVFVLVCIVFVLLFSGASAFARENIAISVEELLGCNVVPYMEFDFTREDARYRFSATDPSLQYVTGGRQDCDEERGLHLYANPDATLSTWRYVPKVKWSSIDDGRVAFFRARPADETGSVYMYTLDSTSAANQMYSMVISHNGIRTGGTYSYLDSDFQPGLDWVDYLVQKTESGVMYYAKSAEQTGGE